MAFCADRKAPTATSPTNRPSLATNNPATDAEAITMLRISWCPPPQGGAPAAWLRSGLRTGHRDSTCMSGPVD